MLNPQEAALEEAISKLNNDVDGKIDRMEMDPLKDYISKNFAFINLLFKSFSNTKSFFSLLQINALKPTNANMLIYQWATIQRQE